MTRQLNSLLSKLCHTIFPALGLPHISSEKFVTLFSEECVLQPDLEKCLWELLYGICLKGNYSNCLFNRAYCLEHLDIIPRTQYALVFCGVNNGEILNVQKFGQCSPRQLLRVIFFLVDKNRIFEIFAAENKKSALCLVMMDDLLSLQNKLRPDLEKKWNHFNVEQSAVIMQSFRPFLSFRKLSLNVLMSIGRFKFAKKKWMFLVESRKKKEHQLRRLLELVNFSELTLPEIILACAPNLLTLFELKILDIMDELRKTELIWKHQKEFMKMKRSIFEQSEDASSSLHVDIDYSKLESSEFFDSITPLEGRIKNQLLSRRQACTLLSKKMSRSESAFSYKDLFKSSDLFHRIAKDFDHRVPSLPSLCGQALEGSPFLSDISENIDHISGLLVHHGNENVEDPLKRLRRQYRSAFINCLIRG